MKCERTDRVAITVQGEPAPGGSKNAFLHRATGRIVVTDAGGKRNKDWRKAVAAAAREAIREAHNAIKASPYPDQQALAKLQPFTKP